MPLFISFPSSEGFQLAVGPHLEQAAPLLRGGALESRRSRNLSQDMGLGTALRLSACKSSHTGQHWFFNAAATTTQAPVSVGLHIKLESGLCLAAKANITRCNTYNTCF